MATALERFAADRRGYFRVETRLRVGLRPAAASEIDGLRREILQREPAGRPRVDPALAEWLTRVEEKLDLLLAQAGLAAPGSLPKTERSLVLSGSGLFLPRSELRCELGSTLLVEFDLPLRPRHAVRCLALVAGNRPEPDGSVALALSFCCIQEEDRDAIVRHSLIVERRALGQRTGGGSESA
jgi:hypothetical protein